MGLFEYIVIYVISWWMLLLMVLPFKTALPTNPQATEYHSAPKKPHLKWKFIITSMLAFIVTFVVSYLIETGMITLWLPYRF